VWGGFNIAMPARDIDSESTKGVGKLGAGALIILLDLEKLLAAA